MTLDPYHAQAAWEDAGRKIASRLDHSFAAVLFGDDAEATAMVALGIAKGHTMRRRVAIADLAGDTPTLAALVKDLDPHGIVDCVVCGLNLGAVAREVPGQVNLFVMPTGKDAVVTEDVFRDERWRKLASSFKEIGALLLIVARSSSSGIRMLARLLDGAIAVGETSEASGSWANLIAAVDLPGEAARRASRLEMAAVTDEAADALTIPAMHTPRHTRAAERAARDSRRRRLLIGAGAAVLSLVLLGGGVWWKRSAIIERLRALTSRGAPGDGGRRATRGSPAPPPISEVASMAANPTDSAAAAAYGVEVAVANTKSGADVKLRELSTSYPSATWGVVLVPPANAQRYSVIIGANASHSGADVDLQTLRRAGVVGTTSGRVVRRPFALLVKENVAHDEALLEILGYQSLGYPAYGLAASDGRVRIYAGAFETSGQARALAASLQQAGIQSTVVYRLGRSL